MSQVTLLYPPQQTHPGIPCKPEASLAYPYLAGALRDAGHGASIYDACVGNERDPLDAIEQGYLDKAFDPDSFTWRQATMKNTTVPAGQLVEIQQAAWTELNGADCQ